MLLITTPRTYLREFNTAEVCWTQAAMIEKINSEKPKTIIRSVALHPGAMTSLGATLPETLQQIDDYFDRVAKLAGAAVVGHTYGLVEVNEGQRSFHELYDGFPKGYDLAAEVEVVQNTEPVDGYSGAKIRNAIRTVDRQTGLRWIDGAPYQYVFGEVDGKKGVWQVDIDPTVHKYS